MVVEMVAATATACIAHCKQVDAAASQILPLLRGTCKWLLHSGKIVTAWGVKWLPRGETVNCMAVAASNFSLAKQSPPPALC